jgi:hypothetical protein
MPTGICIDVRAVQPFNTVLSTILKSPVGRVIDDRDVQPLNVLAFKIVIALGIVIDVREQAAKALEPILKSPEGRDTEVSAVQPINVDC